MKKLIALLLACILVLSAVGFAVAEETQDVKTVRLYTWTYTNHADSQKDFFESDSVYKKAIEEAYAKYGFKLDIDFVPEDQFSVVTQTRQATGYNADIANLSKLDKTTLRRMAETGKILPIDEVIEKYCTEDTKAFFAEGPGAALVRNYTLEDGHLYWITHIEDMSFRGESIGQISRALLIRKDWLDALNLPIPSTVDELEETLKAFQDNDVNGNGVKDEVFDLYDPLSALNVGIAQVFGLGTNILAYVDWDTHEATSIWYETDKLIPYIQWLNKLLNEGLLDPTNMYSTKSPANQVSVYPHWMRLVRDDILVQEGANEAVYVPMVLEGPIEGVPALIGFQEGYNFNSETYCVMGDGDVEAAARYIDYYAAQYDKHPYLGIEGVDYTVNEDGSTTKLYLSDDEKKALTGDEYTEPKTHRVIPGISLTDIEEQMDNAAAAAKAGKSEYYQQQIDLRYQIGKEMMSYPHRAIHDVNGVSATPTEYETEFIDDHKTDLETYAKETLSKLCLGEYSIDDLPKFVEQLDKMGLREYVDIAGARYLRSHPAE